MNKKIVLALVILFLAAIAVTSCNNTKKDAPPHTSDYKESALKYFPLALGNKWTYNVNYFGSAGSIEVLITGTDGEWFLDNRGGKIMADRRGIRDADRYILMFPLQREAWISIIDPRTRETRKTAGVDETVKVPAGTFEGAIKVHTYVELPENRILHSFHYFVADVGIVKIETAIEEPKEGKMIPQTVTELVSYLINKPKS
ncbi:MAG TPA: hypothetical protein VLJ60_11270 [bacterium]|nr:hypothetical protein [bacterium]